MMFAPEMPCPAMVNTARQLSATSRLGQLLRHRVQEAEQCVSRDHAGGEHLDIAFPFRPEQPFPGDAGQDADENGRAAMGKLMRRPVANRTPARRLGRRRLAVKRAGK